MQEPPSGQFQQPPPPNYPMQYGYPNDKPVGIVIMVLSACGVIAGGLALGGGGLLAAGGAASANTSTGAGGAAVAGGLVMILGVVILIVSLLGFAIGYGIMKSLKWGFMVGTIVYGLNSLANLANLSGGKGILGLAISVALFIYCFMRLTGRLGPKPV
jgi:hypothetical protein